MGQWRAPCWTLCGGRRGSSDWRADGGRITDRQEPVVCVDSVAAVPVGRSVRGEGWMWGCSVECCGLTAAGETEGIIEGEE